MWGDEDFENPQNSYDQLLHDSASIISTLENLGAIRSPITGAILFDEGRAQGSELKENIAVAAMASAAHLRDLNRVRREYLPRVDITNAADPARELYNAAYRLAVAHMREAARAFGPSADAEVGFGVLAASIALHRLRTTVFSAHLLYQLRPVYEGDVVARQMLEQVAWALEAARHATAAGVEKIQSQKVIGNLEKLIPGTGALNGLLSKSAHAGIAQHQAHVSRASDGRLLVSEGLSAWLHCAVNLMILSDAAVIVLERTQQGYMSDYIATDPSRDFVPLVKTRFRAEMARIVAGFEEIDPDRLGIEQ